jgi:hypothetical protein
LKEIVREVLSEQAHPQQMEACSVVVVVLVVVVVVCAIVYILCLAGWVCAVSESLTPSHASLIVQVAWHFFYGAHWTFVFECMPASFNADFVAAFCM